MKYLIIVEKTSTGYSSYSPDLDGCVATGRTKEEVEKFMKKAMEFHLEGLTMENNPKPSPHSYSSYVELSV